MLILYHTFCLSSTFSKYKIWVFFIFSAVERLTGRGWAAAIYPAGGDPSAPAHPDGLHITGSRAGRARTRADKYQGIPPPKRWTRCTGLHSIPDRPRRDDRTGCGALDCLRNVSDRARPNGQNNKTYKHVVALRVQLDNNVNIRYTITTT